MFGNKEKKRTGECRLRYYSSLGKGKEKGSKGGSGDFLGWADGLVLRKRTKGERRSTSRKKTKKTAIILTITMLLAAVLLLCIYK